MGGLRLPGIHLNIRVQEAGIAKPTEETAVPEKVAEAEKPAHTEPETKPASEETAAETKTEDDKKVVEDVTEAAKEGGVTEGKPI